MYNATKAWGQGVSVGSEKRSEEVTVVVKKQTDNFPQYLKRLHTLAEALGNLSRKRGAVFTRI